MHIIFHHNEEYTREYTPSKVEKLNKFTSRFATLCRCVNDVGTQPPRAQYYLDLPKDLAP